MIMSEIISLLAAINVKATEGEKVLCLIEHQVFNKSLLLLLLLLRGVVFVVVVNNVQYRSIRI